MSAAARRAPRVLLVAMPFSSPHHPNLGLSLLQAALRRDGIACDIRYLCLEFIEYIGVRRYDVLADDRCFVGMIGEWLFSGLVNGEDTNAELAYCTEVLLGQLRDSFSPNKLIEVLEAHRLVEAFVSRCLGDVPWDDYTIVGFTTSFQQTMASLALARRVKEAHPRVTIALGGANCEGEMGVALHRRYPFIDIVCSGEADLTFPEVVRRHAAGEELAGVPATVVRRGSDTVVAAQANLPVEDMDSLPVPDFTDFFAQHARLPKVAAAYQPVPLFETARGCWWGAKKHCRFCGLNGGTMAYRSKSADRAFAELQDLIARHGRDVLVVDNILDMDYFTELLPRIAGSDLAPLIHYETKVNLTGRQLSLLAAAGIRKIQPGVESLDTEILKLMQKGCTMLQNVQTLKLAAECGVRVEWNFLYGFPGETMEQYARIARIAPRLFHLNAPGGAGRVRADRFSPYFSSPERYGVTLTPLPAYRYVFVGPEDERRRLAYHFMMDSEQLRGVNEYARPAIDVVRRWCAEQSGCALYSFDDGAHVEVVREREGATAQRFVLREAEAAVYRYCWRSRSRAQIGGQLGERHRAAEIDAALAQLGDRELILSEGVKHLALALRQPGWRRGLTAEDLRTPIEHAYVHHVLGSEDDEAPPPVLPGVLLQLGRRAATDEQSGAS